MDKTGTNGDDRSDPESRGEFKWRTRWIPPLRDFLSTVATKQCSVLYVLLQQAYNASAKVAKGQSPETALRQFHQHQEQSRSGPMVGQRVLDFGQSCILARSGRKYSEPMSVSLTAL